MKNTPLVSVVMSVLNAELSLKAAMNSILNQTFTDFEFIVINDGSTDKTAQIIASFNDSRIKVFNQTNHGLIYSLNLGIKKSKGKYIARMDADDLSDIHRLEQQVNYLQANPDIAALGSTFAMTDDANKTTQVFARPTRSVDIQRQLYIQNPLSHGSMMIRKQALVDVGGYSSDKRHIEDYDLWIRLHKAGIYFAVIPEALYYWHNNPDGVSTQNTDLQKKSFEALRADLWSSSKPPVMTIRQLLAGLSWYRSQPGEYAAQITREYVNDQCRLAQQYMKHGLVSPALKQWIAFMFMQPHSSYIVVGGIKDWIVGRLKHLKHLLKQGRR